MKENKEYGKLGLYVHVPFCRHKCAYCDFYSTDKIRCEGGKSEEMKTYCDALINQMRLCSDSITEYDIDSVFIGGGTPTALPEKQLLRLVREIKESFYETDDMEFTVEMNPATADEKLLRKLYRAGVNRLSIGLQSADDRELHALSRIHTREQFEESFEMARDAGFENINVDLMYGIPEQTPGSLEDTLAYVTALDPEHISLYNLILEEGTPLYEARDSLKLPDEETEFRMYCDAIAALRAQGYGQYEISNFAKPGFECRHNLRYWNCEEYIGFGPAAHSYFAGKRFSVKPMIGLYTKTMLKKPKELPEELLGENVTVDRREQIIEYIMLQFRLTRGLDTRAFAARFHADFDEVFGKKCALYVQHGFMTHENGRYAFTPTGMYVSNTILSQLLPFGSKSAVITGKGGAQ